MSRNLLVKFLCNIKSCGWWISPLDVQSRKDFFLLILNIIKKKAHWVDVVIVVAVCRRYNVENWSGIGIGWAYHNVYEYNNGTNH